jgi:signal transduction histidine kinase
VSHSADGPSNETALVHNRPMLSRSQPAQRLLLVVLTLANLAWVDAASAADRQKHVLVLHSNRRDALIALLTDRELPRLIEAGFPERVDYYSEYIDLPRFSEPGYESAFCEFLRLKYQSMHLDAVVAVQDTAIEFVRNNRGQLFVDTPIVFLANEAPPAMRNSTGVIVERKLDGTLAFAVALQPDVRNVFVVSGANESDKVFERMARAQFKPFESRLNFTYLSGLATGELMSRLRQLPAHSIVYYLLVYQNSAGENFHPFGYLDILAPVSSAPVYSWVDSMMDRGIVGGRLLSQEGELRALSDLVLRVLAGEPADSIPRSMPDAYVTQVDWRQLRRWGISKARIPTGTLVRFKEPNGWDRYRGYILGVVVILLAQSVLIAGLLVQKRMRRRAEIQVRDNEAALRTSNERIHDLGGRLLLAQEAERARIARELHDDVNQQVALLAIDLELLREGRQRPDAATLVEEACDRAHGIAKSLHDLSHQLHPARLRMLGLVPALSGLQRELSRPDCVIDFSSDSVPNNLPQDITLCLFRVAQEALHNALTHSEAGRVSVQLVGEPNRLVMTIVDDGVGFDVDDAWRKGLGLVSMGERLESVAGTLDIQSRNGSGTRLSISVPLPAARPPEPVSV